MKKLITVLSMALMLAGCGTMTIRVEVDCTNGKCGDVKVVANSKDTIPSTTSLTATIPASVLP